MPLGLYISVPFCRTKCSYCNFASDVFSRAVFEKYVDRVCDDIRNAKATAEAMGGVFEREIDSIYLGGGTPSVLESQQLERLFVTVQQEFRLLPETEVTVECAPGTLSSEMIATLIRCGVNRVSLGVQSFVDQEAAAVGRLHKRETVLSEIEALRAAGISNINVDLIAGLPHQTGESWERSLTEVIESNVPHVSVYMLEVDQDSRLGRELIAGGTKYHAHFVPDDDAIARFYERATERLDTARIRQYEISNFARDRGESCHNLKYWTRQPYLGFGVDAHSMLKASDKSEAEAVRFSTPDALERYVAGDVLEKAVVTRDQGLEECFFLGLRLNRGVNLDAMSQKFGASALSANAPVINEMVRCGLLVREGDQVRLTSRGRILSNEVFERFVGVQAT
jgi:putative oxygen-independent coproporphyrinogen III oxidase